MQISNDEWKSIIYHFVLMSSIICLGDASKTIGGSDFCSLKVVLQISRKTGLKEHQHHDPMWLCDCCNHSCDSGCPVLHLTCLKQKIWNDVSHDSDKQSYSNAEVKMWWMKCVHLLDRMNVRLHRNQEVIFNIFMSLMTFLLSAVR